MEIYLIRHTKLNIEEGICYGQSEIPLADSFLDEVRVLKQKLPAHFDVIYTSTSQRCMALAEELSCDIKESSLKLLELNFGDWEKVKWNDIDLVQLDYWMKDFVHVAVPNGESYLDLHIRVNEFLNDLIEKNYARVAIITHAGVIRSLICSTLGLALEHSFNLSIDAGKVSLFEITTDQKLVKYINA